MGSAGKQLKVMRSADHSYAAAGAAAAGWPDCAMHVDGGSAQITISHSSFEQLGGCGIAIRDAVSSVHVLGCLFTSIAAHGVMVHGFEGTAVSLITACPSLL